MVNEDLKLILNNYSLFTHTTTIMSVKATLIDSACFQIVHNRTSKHSKSDDSNSTYQKPQITPEQLEKIGELGLCRILLNFVGDYTDITPDQLKGMTLQELAKAVRNAFNESEKDSFHASSYMNPKERINPSGGYAPTNVSTLALVRYHRDTVCKVFKKYFPELFLWINPRKDRKTGKNITGTMKHGELKGTYGTLYDIKIFEDRNAGKAAYKVPNKSNGPTHDVVKSNSKGPILGCETEFPVLSKKAGKVNDKSYTKGEFLPLSFSDDDDF